jgi:hypothetical protein
MVQLLKQSVKIVEGPEDRIDSAVVRNIVAKNLASARQKTASITRLQLRAIEDDRCGPFNSLRMCLAIAVAVLERNRSDLIKHRTSPHSDVLGGLLKVVSPV